MDRRRSILDAAAAAFQDKGFHGVGVDEIGTRAGMSGPSLYRHFSGKDEILGALLDAAMDELMAATEPRSGDPASDLERALRHHIAFALGNRHVVSLYQREVRSLVDPWRRAFAERRGAYTRRWEELFAGALPGASEEQVAATVQVCLGAVFSVPSWPADTLRTADLERLFLTVLTAGFSAVGEHSPA